ncbi:MAG: hypothetical protein ACKV0T_23155 [Planctomycetales bacterium]
MADHDAAMLAFAKLAGLSQDRQQLGPRDKFLILAGTAALRAGWPAVAERCRELILSHNPRHLIGQSASFADALRNDDFQVFLRQAEKFCSYEKGEHLLSQNDLTPDLPRTSARFSPGEYALLLLGRGERPNP